MWHRLYLRVTVFEFKSLLYGAFSEERALLSLLTWWGLLSIHHLVVQTIVNLGLLHCICTEVLLLLVFPFILR